MENGAAIAPGDLDACAEALGVSIESGDIVMVRTGLLSRCKQRASWEGYAGGAAPGLSIHCARWIYEREIAAVASDTSITR